MMRTFGYAFAAGALMFATYAFWCVWLGWRSLHWPRVVGSVVETWKDLRLGGYRPVRAYWVPGLRYEYEVNGHTYSAEAIRVTHGFDRHMMNPERTRLYTRGRRVEVSYDRHSPSRAVLEPGIPGAAWMYLVVAFLFAGLGYFFHIVSQH